MEEEKGLCSLPVVPLTDVVLLPGMVRSVAVRNNKSKNAIAHATRRGGRIMVFFVPKEAEQLTEGDFPPVGTKAVIRQVGRNNENDNLTVLLEGEGRVGHVRFSMLEPYLSGVAQELSIENNFTTLPEEKLQFFRDELIVDVTEYIRMNPPQKDLLERIIKDNSLSLRALVFQLSAAMRATAEDMQAFLEKDNELDRLYCLKDMIMTAASIQSIRNEINAKVRQRMDKNQREYVLRESAKVISKELGNDGTALDELEQQLQDLEAPAEVKEKLLKDYKNFKTLQPGGQEYAVLQSYFTVMLEIPWEKRTKDNVSLVRAREVLNRDHYGLTKVKERVLEYLAVRQLTNTQSTILCLVGPPGTGKTSIARSVAEALEKKYIRMSLGGLHDEAEIRGHRKTYVGAMPGRIAQTIRTVGVINPVIVLDEIDKIGHGGYSDPQAALLEVLDSEQNKAFRDNYLEVPLNLSEVLFIATANDLGEIPGPLRDRLEIIEVSSYTETEKLHIAEEFLLKKQIQKNGLPEGKISLPRETYLELIRGYTREAGVRELERLLASLCRKVAVKWLESGDESVVTINPGEVKGYLGKRKFSQEEDVLLDQVGIVHGLAWTAVGGDTLEIEVNVLPGSGKLILTGKLGEVMKESSQIALSFVKSLPEVSKLGRSWFEERDLHVHVPEGAVPKDGPSAGITMATALYSAIMKKPVRGDLAMTGEITLRGRILPIGGLKEKLLAAYAAGIKTVCVPEKNRADVEEMSEEVTGNLEILFVSEETQVLKKAILS